MRSKGWIVVLLLVSALPLGAAERPYVRRETPQREGRFWSELDACFVPVKAGGRLTVRADLGTVTVVPGAGADRLQCAVKLIAYTPSESEAHAFFARSILVARRAAGGGAYLDLRVPDQDRPGRRLEAFLSIQVPRHFNLDIQTGGGAVQVAGLQGELHAVTVGGDIRTGDLTGPVRVQTAGGNISLGNIGQRVEAHSAGGSIRVGDVNGDADLESRGGDIAGGMVSGSAHAFTAAGDIVFRGVSGSVWAQTAGGQIQLGQCGGPVHAETGAGSIRLDGARGGVVAQTAGGSIDLLQLMGAVRAETSAGDILAQIDAGRDAFSASSLESLMGDVHVFLPSDLPLTINALIGTGVGHTIASDFPLTVRRQQLGDLGLGPVQGAAALDGGGALLNLRTTLGSIEIRKQNAEALARVKACQQSFWRTWQDQVKEQQQSLVRLQQAMQEQEQRMEQLQKVLSQSNGQQ